MSIHYRNYKWKEGIPCGIDRTEPIGVTYKIPMDPYRRRISIEQYKDGIFEKIIYDSHFINFRHLKPEHQMAWEKKRVGDICEIRDQDDRLQFREEYLFKGELCVECRTTSPHGVLLSVHKMHYESLGDPFNGVVLYDTNGCPVLQKVYEIDKASGQYTELIKENASIQEEELLHFR